MRKAIPKQINDMTKRKTILLVLLLALLLPLHAAKRKNLTGICRVVDGHATELSFCSPSIVRVRVFPGTDTNIRKKSYSVLLKPGQNVTEPITEEERDGKITLRSSMISATLDLQTGYITFSDNKGTELLQATGHHFSPCSHDVDHGKYQVSQCFRLTSDEAVYGLGQLRDTLMSHRGQKVEMWNHNTYISIPFFLSGKGYGLYWDNAGRSLFDDTAAETMMSSEVAPFVDYYFLYRDGTADGVIASVRELSGQATLPPLWAMGFWQCRERYKTSDELVGVLDKYRELKIPVDAMVQDWQYWGCDSNWNAMRFMNPYYINKVGDPAWQRYLPGDMKNLKPQQPRIKSPQEMVDYVHRNNGHLMISIWANFGPWTDQYKELNAIGALYPFDTWPRNQGVKVYDAFNPKARNIYWKYLTNLQKMGFDAWWTDSSEPDHFEKSGDDDWMTADGSWRSVKNAFPLVHNRGIYEHQRATKESNAKRALMMTRSASFGIQHYGTFSWSGDILASWQEMKQQIPSGLNYSLCGIPYWNTDLGGFFYWEFEQDPHNPALQELQTRWMEWGAFMPLMRNHCSSPMVSELYRFGKEGDWCYDAIVKYIRLRYRLLPYTYSSAADCVLNSGTMMRALVMDFANDRHAATLNSEYLFGRNLLVKPVTDPMYTWKDSKKRGHLIYPDVSKAAAPTTAYLPKGTLWYDFWDDQPHVGGQTIQRLCPIDIMPVYVKAGAIMPFGPDVQYSTEKPWDDLEMKVYCGANGHFELYEDEGNNYNYERGHYTLIPFDYDESTHTLTIGNRKGAYKGMLSRRRFRITAVDGNGKKAEQTVEYTGKKCEIKL